MCNQEIKCVFLLLTLCVYCCCAQNITGWVLGESVPSPIPASSILLKVSPPTYPLFVNSTWEIIDNSGKTVDVVSYNQTNAFVYWNIPANIPTSTRFAVRITTQTDVFTSPYDLVVYSSVFKQCSLPPFYPTTRSNVSDIYVHTPALGNMQFIDPPAKDTTKKIQCGWDFVNALWSLNKDVAYSLEVVQVKDMVFPSSAAQIIDGNLIIWSYQYKARRGRVAYFMCRLNYTNKLSSGERKTYSYRSNVFFFGPVRSVIDQRNCTINVPPLPETKVESHDVNSQVSPIVYVVIGASVVFILAVIGGSYLYAYWFRKSGIILFRGDIICKN
ncbi:hypothetical protein HK098_001141 [Nowakowskiella sp. JEL0407]|nr:hypothetical protein HK098_001141 [Nowakowskiella sp. JEL0407]